MLPVLILLPFVTALALNLPVFSGLKRVAFVIIAALAALQVVIILAVANISAESVNLKMVMSISGDSTSCLMLLTLGIIFFCVAFVGQHTIPDGEGKDGFFIFILLMMVSLNGAVIVRDLFAFYLFIEVSSLILLAIFKGTSRSFSSIFMPLGGSNDSGVSEVPIKFIILNCLSSALILTAIAIVFAITGETGFTAVRNAFINSGESVAGQISISLFLIGFMIKAGLAPFHFWISDIFTSTSCAVSILFDGAFLKATAVYAIICLGKELFINSPALNTVLLLAGAISVVLGNLAATGQKDLKKMLSFACIGQSGYILLGMGSGSDLGVAGALLHLFTLSVSMSSLLSGTAALERQTGVRDVDSLAGLGGKMPVTAWTTLVASMSIVGIPPLAGFWSKLIILFSIWRTGATTIAMICLLSNLLTLSSFLVLQRKIFMAPDNVNFENVREADFGLLLPAILLTAITVSVGILFPWIAGTFLFPVDKI